jgi:iron complex outermembrane receptor protein
MVSCQSLDGLILRRIFMKKFFWVLLAGAALHSAFAQDSGVAEKADESLDFVITAGRTAEEAAKVSGQLTVITAEDIAASGATTVTDVLQTVPGIRLGRDTSSGGAIVTMRGISDNTARGKVLVIIDGMRLSPIEARSAASWDTINLSEVERIEVLDGGASVQYGDNAMAGVINIITKKSGAAKTDITVSTGSFFQNEQRFSHYHPTDWGGFTVSGGHQGTQGYQKHTAGDSANGALRGFFDISDAMSLQANVGVAVRNQLFSYGFTEAQFDDDPTQNVGLQGMGSSSDNMSTTFINAGLGFDWAINDVLSLDAPVSYNFTEGDYYAPTSASVRKIKTPYMIGVRPKITAELRPANMGLRFTGGVDAFFASSGLEISTDLSKEANPTVQTASEITVGPWALVNFEPLSFLSVNAGLRYDTAFVKAHNDEWSGTVQIQGAPVPLTIAAGDESTQWGAFTYEAGIVANPVDFLKVYVKYGTQFKYPYLDEIVTTPASSGKPIALNTGLEPEKGWTAEGGAGLNIKDIARLDANFYYLRIDNEIFYTLQQFTTENLDPIDRIGSNIGLELTPVKYVSMDINYGFVNAKFTEGDFEGKTVPMVAAHTLSGSLMLHAPFGLSLGPNILYKSDMYAGYDYANENPGIDPSLIWGLQARYVINKFKGELAVILTLHNLADTKYASMAFYTPPIPAYGTPGGTTYYVDPNMGRSVNVSVQYRF